MKNYLFLGDLDFLAVGLLGNNLDSKDFICAALFLWIIFFLATRSTMEKAAIRSFSFLLFLEAHRVNCFQVPIF